MNKINSCYQFTVIYALESLRNITSIQVDTKISHNEVLTWVTTQVPSLGSLQFTNEGSQFRRGKKQWRQGCGRVYLLQAIYSHTALWHRPPAL